MIAGFCSFYDTCLDTCLEDSAAQAEMPPLNNEEKQAFVKPNLRILTRFQEDFHSIPAEIANTGGTELPLSSGHDFQSHFQSGYVAVYRRSLMFREKPETAVTLAGGGCWHKPIIKNRH